MNRVIVTMAVLIAVSSPAWAAGDRLPVSGTTAMFCKMGNGSYERFARTDYDGFSEAFTRQFGYSHALHLSSKTLGSLVYSTSGDDDAAGNAVTYDVEPHDGGIALLHMHILIDQKQTVLSGTSMCDKSLDILEAR